MASIKVVVRVRPISQREKDLQSDIVVSVEDDSVSLEDKHASAEKQRQFQFDHCFWSVHQHRADYVSQKMIHSALGHDIVHSVQGGYNACVFAYGQTGSGKTHTMIGPADDPGLIPNVCEELLDRLSEINTRIHLSYLEIYNEKVTDLLDGASRHLKIREHPKNGPYVENLTRHRVYTYSDISALLTRGCGCRSTAGTKLNAESSRSHAVVTLRCTQLYAADSTTPRELHSKLHLVDLAGSERSDTAGTTGKRLKEGASINRSLVTLGSVISALAQKSSLERHSERCKGSPSANRSLSSSRQINSFVPYRDSTLTWLLKDSLGGNAKTLMIATISPTRVNYSETLSTLRYASIAKKIVNKPRINEDANVKLIRELKEENARLKSQLLEQNVDKVKERMETNEIMMNELIERWNTKWMQNSYYLENTNTMQPHLVSLDDEATDIFFLNDEITTIGSTEHQDNDIELCGDQVRGQHCRLRQCYSTNDITLEAIHGAKVSVNGVQVGGEPVVLKQGAVICVSDSHMFKFNDPRLIADFSDASIGDRLTTSCTSISDSAIGSELDLQSISRSYCNTCCSCDRLYTGDIDLDNDSRQRRSNSCHPAFAPPTNSSSTAANLPLASSSTSSSTRASTPNLCSTSAPSAPAATFHLTCDGDVNLDDNEEEDVDLPTPTANSTFQEHVVASGSSRSRFPVLICHESPICRPEPRNNDDGEENGATAEVNHNDSFAGQASSNVCRGVAQVCLDDINVGFPTTTNSSISGSLHGPLMSLYTDANLFTDVSDCGAGEGIACCTSDQENLEPANHAYPDDDADDDHGEREQRSLNGIHGLIGNLNLTESIHYSQEIFSKETSQCHLHDNKTDDMMSNKDISGIEKNSENEDSFQLDDEMNEFMKLSEANPSTFELREPSDLHKDVTTLSNVIELLRNHCAHRYLRRRRSSPSKITSATYNSAFSANDTSTKQAEKRVRNTFTALMNRVGGRGGYSCVVDREGMCAAERNVCKKLEILKREIETADLLREIDNNIQKCEELYDRRQYHLISPLVDTINDQLNSGSPSDAFAIGANAGPADRLSRAVLTEFKTASVIILEKTLYECSEVWQRSLKWTQVNSQPKLTIVDRKEFAIAVLGLSSGMMDCRARHLVEELVRRIVVPLVACLGDKLPVRLLTGNVIGVELNAGACRAIPDEDEVFSSKFEAVTKDGSARDQVDAASYTENSTGHYNNMSSSHQTTMECNGAANINFRPSSREDHRLSPRISSVSSTASSVCTITADLSSASGSTSLSCTTSGAQSCSSQFCSSQSSPRESHMDSGNDTGQDDGESPQLNPNFDGGSITRDTIPFPRKSSINSAPTIPQPQGCALSSFSQTCGSNSSTSSHCSICNVIRSDDYTSSLVFALDCVTELISRLCSALFNNSPSIQADTSSPCDRVIDSATCPTGSKTISDVKSAVLSSANSKFADNEIYETIDAVCEDELSLIRRAGVRYSAYVRRRAASSSSLYDSLQQLLIGELTSSLNRHLADYASDASSTPLPAACDIANHLRPLRQSQDRSFASAVKAWREFNAVYRRCATFDDCMYAEINNTEQTEHNGKRVVFSPTPLKDHSLVDSLKILALAYIARYKSLLVRQLKDLLTRNRKCIRIENNKPQNHNPDIFNYESPDCTLSLSRVQFVNICSSLVEDIKSADDTYRPLLVNCLDTLVTNYAREHAFDTNNSLDDYNIGVQHTDNTFVCRTLANVMTPACRRIFITTSDLIYKSNAQFSSHLNTLLLQITKNIHIFDLLSLSDHYPQSQQVIADSFEILSSLRNRWSPILPKELCMKAMGYLVDHLLRHLLSLLIKCDCFSSLDSNCMYTLFNSDVTASVLSLFNDDMYAAIDVIGDAMPKMTDVTFLFNNSLELVVERWCDGKGPLALHINPAEMSSLITAIYENTGRRRYFLHSLNCDNNKNQYFF